MGYFSFSAEDGGGLGWIIVETGGGLRVWAGDVGRSMERRLEDWCCHTMDRSADPEC